MEKSKKNFKKLQIEKKNRFRVFAMQSEKKNW